MKIKNTKNWDVNVTQEDYGKNNKYREQVITIQYNYSEDIEVEDEMVIKR